MVEGKRIDELEKIIHYQTMQITILEKIFTGYLNNKFHNTIRGIRPNYDNYVDLEKQQFYSVSKGTTEHCVIMDLGPSIRWECDE